MRSTPPFVRLTPKWQAIIASCDQRVHRYVRTATRRDEAAAEDLCAETFARAWLHRVEVTGSDCPVDVVLGFAREVCRDYVYVRRHEVPLDDTERSVIHTRALATPPKNTMSVDEAMAQKAWVQRVLHLLSHSQEAAVNLTHYYTFPTDIVAAVLEVASGTVRVHVFRGLKRLKKIETDDPFPFPRERHDE